MNYYLELLESYSKLKKRSLKLNKEQEEDTSLLEKMVGKKKKGEAVLKQGETGSRKGSSKKMAMGKERQVVSSAKQVVQIGMTAGNNYIKLLHPDGKQKLSVGKSTSQSGNVLIRARFGGHSWGTPIADETGASTGSQLQGYGELEQWLRSAGQPGAAGGDEEENKEQSDKDVKAEDAQKATDLANSIKQQEAAEAQQREVNKAALIPLAMDIGYPSDKPTDELDSQFGDGFDFFGEDGSGDEFVEYTKGFVDKLVDDVTLDLQVKQEALENLRELVGVASAIKRGETYGPEGTLSDRLRTLKNSIGKGNRGGEIALSREQPTDKEKKLANDILLIGRVGNSTKGHAIPAFSTLARKITSGVNAHNKAIKDPASKHYIEKDWYKVGVTRSGTPGSDANRRCDIDEGLVAAAGIIHSLGDLGGLVGSDLKGESDLKKKFLKQKLKDSVTSIVGEESLADVAAYLRSGLDQEMDANVTTLLNADAADFAVALSTRLQKDVGMSEDEAGEFLEGLAEEGKKVVALALLLRYNTVKSIFGGVQPEYSVGVGRRGEKIAGRKVDNAFVFRTDQADALKKQLNKMTGLTKGIKGYTEKGTIQSFIDKNILSADDFPEDQSLEDTVLLHRFSLKTHNNHNNDSSQGSARASSVVTPAPVTEYVTDPNTGKKVKSDSYEFREQIKGHVGDMVGKAAQEKFYEFIDGCRPAMYDDKGKPLDDSKTQNINFWNLVRKKSQGLEGTELSNFQKSLATYLLVLGGGSRANQLNIVSYTQEGDFTVQDDHSFRANALEKIKNGTWKIKAPVTGKDSSIITITGEVDGKIRPLLKLNGTGERNDIWKLAAYQQELLKEQNKTPEQENSSTMLRQFLSAQAKMIQELLATE